MKLEQTATPPEALPQAAPGPLDTPAGAETPTPAQAAEDVSQAADATRQVIETWLGDLPQWAQPLLALTALALLAWIAHLLVRRYALRLIGVAMKRLPSFWATIAAEQKVFHRLVPLVPTIIIGRGVAFVPHLPAAAVVTIERVAMGMAILFVALAFGALLNTINAIYSRYPISHGRPIKGYLQVAKLIAYIAAGILILAALMDQSPLIFLSGLGAMMAVILLVFRDTLLSLVAGIQLVNNDLIRVGDWIEMPQLNADGDVIDISLNVVRVSNWDKTITAIPTHKFLENSFKNWRGMTESGGRRIKRALRVDMSTIRFLTEEEVKRFARFRLLRDYIAAKVKELNEYNRAVLGETTDDGEPIIANSRCLTNVGTFRAYIAEYLKQHPLVNQEMTLLVRQLEPGPTGLPIELYLFIKDTRWAVYENAQSDIFDHILAIAGEFGLRIFQEPSGADVTSLRGGVRFEPELATRNENGHTARTASASG